MEPYLRVGVFASTHGIKGEICVYPTVDDPARFLKLSRVYFETKSGMREMTLEGVRFHKSMVLLTFAGVSEINQILPYKGLSLYIAREDAVPLPEGRYYIADLLGCLVETDDGRILGKVKDVLETGANDVFLVRGEKDGTPKDYLIPHIRQCVLDVNVEQSRILVHMLDGLEDL